MSRAARLGPACLLRACLLLACLAGRAVAEEPAAPPPTRAIEQAVVLNVGTGRLLQLPGPAATVLAADPRIARVQPASATTLFVMAVAVGHTTIIATTTDGSPVASYDVTVEDPAAAAAAEDAAPAPLAATGPPKIPPLDAQAIEEAIHQSVFGTDRVRAGGTDDALLLTGEVANAGLAQQVMAIARSFAGKEQTIVDQMTVLSTIQVNVRVRVIEISREITRELGFNWQSLFSSGNFAIGFVTSGVAAPLAAVTAAGQALRNLATRTGSTSLSGLPNRLAAGYNSSNFDLNAIIDALAADQLITVLAEPNLTAQSGETASFLAGGEFPVPVAATDTGQISIEFKQFGISLAFVPTVLAPDRLNLHVRPEVSDLSDNGSINLPVAGGTLRIPALSVRRAETTVELGSGQSFAIAGLLQRSSSQLSNGVPGLSELPVLGALFKSEAFKRNESELVIIVTPYLVQPTSDPGALKTPLDDFQPATDLERLLEGRQTAAVGPAGLSAPADPVRLAPFDAGFILE